MDAVVAYGTPLIDDAGRIGEVTALGVDETLFVRRGKWNERSWVTSIVDITPARSAARRGRGPHREGTVGLAQGPPASVA
jgi:hypothetical protein